jgi:hypothetical protein
MFFFNAEIKNLKCHIILRDLKKYNNGKKAPPLIKMDLKLILLLIIFGNLLFGFILEFLVFIGV